MRDASVALEVPVFVREDGHWQPHEEAAGPFGGLHGGAVSGLIVAELERAAREQGMGLLISAGVLLLRPAPMAPLETRLEVLRKGGRVGAIECALASDGKLIAKGFASFVAPQTVSDVPGEKPLPADPTGLPPWPMKPRLPHKTLFDALDLRAEPGGRVWGRLTRRLVPFACPVAEAFAVADNGQPFSLGDPRDLLSRFSFPNIDIALHLSRPPLPGWVGVRARSDWRAEGMGLTESELYDEAGRFGRCCQSIVLIPRS